MNSKAPEFADYFAEARKNLVYHVEGAILEFTEELWRLMQDQGVTKAELAKRLGCQPAYITKLLSGGNNFTLETMVKVAQTLGAELKVHLQAPGVESVWMDVNKYCFENKSVPKSISEISQVEFGKLKLIVAQEIRSATQTSAMLAANNELALAA